MTITEGISVTAIRGDADEVDDTYTVAKVGATPEGLHVALTKLDDAGTPQEPWTDFWDRLTAERIARAILAELAATKR